VVVKDVHVLSVVFNLANPPLQLKPTQTLSSRSVKILLTQLPAGNGATDELKLVHEMPLNFEIPAP
jgi:hypothetical protein